MNRNGRWGIWEAFYRIEEGKLNWDGYLNEEIIARDSMWMSGY